jgi:hypothetical protein
MAVQITASGEHLDTSRVQALEGRLRTTLPPEYAEFLLTYNVARPEENVYRMEKLTISVSYFFGVSSDSVSDLVTQNQVVFANRLPKRILAIAYAAGGNLVCLRTSDGLIYLWDHEKEANEGEEPRYENMTRLARSFSDKATDFFPNASKVKSVKLKPGFQEKFKKYM